MSYISELLSFAFFYSWFLAKYFLFIWLIKDIEYKRLSLTC